MFEQRCLGQRLEVDTRYTELAACSARWTASEKTLAEKKKLRLGDSFCTQPSADRAPPNRNVIRSDHKRRVKIRPEVLAHGAHLSRRRERYGGQAPLPPGQRAN